MRVGWTLESGYASTLKLMQARNPFNILTHLSWVKISISIHMIPQLVLLSTTACIANFPKSSSFTLNFAEHLFINRTSYEGKLLSKTGGWQGLTGTRERRAIKGSAKGFRDQLTASWRRGWSWAAITRVSFSTAAKTKISGQLKLSVKQARWSYVDNRRHLWSTRIIQGFLSIRPTRPLLLLPTQATPRTLTTTPPSPLLPTQANPPLPQTTLPPPPAPPPLHLVSPGFLPSMSSRSGAWRQMLGRGRERTRSTRPTEGSGKSCPASRTARSPSLRHSNWLRTTSSTSHRSSRTTRLPSRPPSSRAPSLIPSQMSI